MTVGHRGREMAIRMALGSTRAGLIRLLVRQQLSAVVTGLIAGGMAAAWAARFLQRYMYEIAVYDPGLWSAAIAVVTLAAVLGAVMPSWRASRHDRMHVLRAD